MQGFAQQNLKSTTEKEIDSLNIKSAELASYNTELSLELANRALVKSEVGNYIFGRVEALVNIASVNRGMGNFSLSFQYLKEALRLAYLKDDKLAIAHCLYQAGDLHKWMGNFEAAIPFLKSAHTLYKKENDHLKEIICINNLAHVYMEMGARDHTTNDYLKAIDLYLNTKDLSDKYNLPGRKTIAYVNLANAYNVLGNTMHINRYLDKSLDYSSKSFALAKSLNDSSKMAISLSNMGEAMESKGQIENANSSYKQALDMYNEIGELNRVILCAEYLSVSLKKQNRLDEAIYYAKLGVLLSEQQNQKKNLINGHLHLAELYQEKGEFKQALYHQKVMSQYKDSLFTEKNLTAMARLKVEFDLERKDREIQLLNKDKELQEAKLNNSVYYRNALVTGLILFALAFVILYLRFTEKKRLTKQLLIAKEDAEHARIMQEQFLANTSHEIRTPMNGIIGMANQMKELNLNTKQREYLSAIQESADHLLVIINDLLDISRMKAGKMVFQDVNFNLKELMQNIRLLFNERCRDKGIAFEMNFDKKIPAYILGDKVRLSQILNNLIGNAVKFTEKGVVKVNVQLIDEKENKLTIRFKVTDTGIGIPEDKLAHIFESFAQADAKTTRKFGGTGLGLTISKQLIDQLNGKISVESKPDKGSSFDVELTFAAADQSLLVEENVPQEKPDLNGMKILVVDDNKLNRKVAKLTLAKWNAHVYLAESAKEAFKVLNDATGIELVLMDITMPEMDGFEATQFIRSNYKGTYANVPIAAMTASAFTGDREKCLSMGMDDYISKPFKSGDLYALVLRQTKQKENALTEEQKRITDFGLLHEKADGDRDYLIDILSLYLEEMPGYIEELSQVTASKDKQRIRDQVHKMKSPIGLFGANGLKETMQHIELQVLEKGLTPELEIKITEVKEKCKASLTEVQLELNRILVQENAK
jgi:signal transduction histidine kinase/response regulator RpfG family c-di-GMP phosphodiesterase